MRKWMTLFGLLWAGSLWAGNLTSMGEAPDWSRLDEYQAQVTFSDFRWLLESQYAPGGAASDWITVEPERAIIKREANDPQPIELRFRKFEEHSSPPPRYWRTKGEWLSDKQSALPLAGLRIALDPGHIGGEYAAMEFRSWKVGEGPLFREGDFVLKVSQQLKPELEALGAMVTLVRDKPLPVTTDTPDSLIPLAEKLTAEQEALSPGLQVGGADREAKIKALARLLFYRVSEIKARAALINETIQPDLVLCLHVDGATPKKDEKLVDRGYAHYLVNGAYSAAELSYDDQRYQMLERLLCGAWREERALAGEMALSFYESNGLPPHVYKGDNAVRINEDPYIWARNLMANRNYQCPTVFLEPCVANTTAFYTRFGQDEQSLINEYANAVTTALIAYYTAPKNAQALDQ